MSDDVEYKASDKPTFSHILDELNSAQNGTNARQALIKTIEKETKGKIVVYTSCFNHPASGISLDDIIAYEDMLKSIGNTEKISLIIHSPGGDPDAAEKMVKMTRNYCNRFVVIVPNSAKSAATLISLGSDEIMMGHLSELGPIDPQISYKLPNGQWVMRPSQTIIDSFEKIKAEVDKSNKLSQAYIPILNNIDIALIDYCERANKRARELAETLLEEYMLKSDHDKAEEIANYLADGGRHLSHSKIIDRASARELGLNITDIDKDSKLWKLIWELYCRTDIFLKQTKAIKLYETANNSLRYGDSRA